jgi:hypothetical protein
VIAAKRSRAGPRGPFRAQLLFAARSAFRAGAGRCRDDLQAHSSALTKASSSTDKIGQSCSPPRQCSSRSLESVITISRNG